jgi:alpha-N-acetylglucosamine transferase
LEKQYLSQVQSGQTQKAQKTYSQIQQVKHSRQERSQKARELAAKKLSIMKAAELFTKRHALPQVDSNGRATLQDTKLRYTRHAVQRLEERQVSEADIQRVLSQQVAVDKRHASAWGVQSEEVTLIGVFLDEPEGKTFVIKTIWRNDASQAEQKAELAVTQ